MEMSVEQRLEGILAYATTHDFKRHGETGAELIATMAREALNTLRSTTIKV